MFRHRLREHRKQIQGINYYYREVDYNWEQVKEFYMSLDGFGITEEYFTKYAIELFLLINQSHQTENDKASKFMDILNAIQKGTCNEENMSEFFN